MNIHDGHSGVSASIASLCSQFYRRLPLLIDNRPLNWVTLLAAELGSESGIEIETALP